MPNSALNRTAARSRVSRLPPRSAGSGSGMILVLILSWLFGRNLHYSFNCVRIRWRRLSYTE